VKPRAPAHELGVAADEAALLACLPVMQELRPHCTAEDWLDRVRRQQAFGYTLAFCATAAPPGAPLAGRVRAVAGFVRGEKLAWGRHIYVDDLVTLAAHRGEGWGLALLEWIFELARREGLDSVHLDSGVQRHGAHRFYLLEGMDITSHHFARRFTPAPPMGSLPGR